jgi:hypothetical protein
MKTRFSSTLAAVLQFLAVSLFAIAVNARAQLPPSDPSMPVVTLTAPDPMANEAGDPGAFRLIRYGPTNLALNVFWMVGGSASNGVDYQSLPAIVNIPAGVREVLVPLVPIDDKLVEGPETVTARLFYPPFEAPQTFVIGWPSNAIVAILDNDPAPTNRPPFVGILTPLDGAVFFYPDAVQIIAGAQDPDPGDYVDTVEFFDGPNSLGVRTNCLPCASPINPFMLSPRLPPGDHVLTAKATDSHGASSASDPVHVSVRMPPQLVVTIQATDPNASEPGLLTVLDPGVFTVTRTGATNFPLPVYYSIHGTASNGLDYAAISNQVVISIGKSSADVTIWPLGDNLVEGPETVVLRLEDVPCIAIYPPPPECYLVGTQREAVVFIADFNRPTNRAPEVRITKPLDGQIFLAPAEVLLRAETVDSDGYVDHVEFYADAKQIGEETRNYFTAPPPGEPATFEMVWTNPPPGRHTLTARARDELGAFGISLPAVIWVVETNQPPVTNPPPIVTLTAPDPIAAEGTNCCHWIGWSNSPPGTFCGTNTATFVIRRFGPTNDSLTVHYRIGGTASNGVDYVTLPGLVTIPAGQRAVEIKLIPLDDALPERLETVVLGLRAPPNLTSSVPPYLVGFPARAAAVIVDNDAPRPPTSVLADRCFHLMKPGANGSWWRIECSTDLLHWTILGTNSVTDGALHFLDPNADERPSGYYRAVPCEPPVD